MNTLSKEELLKPRVKVIADYPGSVFKVGAVLTLRPMKYPTSTKEWSTVRDTPQLGDASIYGEIEGYPAIFRKLQWWEERTVDEMPEYLKLISERTSLLFVGSVYPVKEWVKETGEDFKCEWLARVDDRELYRFAASHFEPATREEYEAASQKEAAQSDPKKEQP